MTSQNLWSRYGRHVVGMTLMRALKGEDLWSYSYKVEYTRTSINIQSQVRDTGSPFCDKKLEPYRCMVVLLYVLTVLMHVGLTGQSPSETQLSHNHDTDTVIISVTHDKCLLRVFSFR